MSEQETPRHGRAARVLGAACLVVALAAALLALAGCADKTASERDSAGATTSMQSAQESAASVSSSAATTASSSSASAADSSAAPSSASTSSAAGSGESPADGALSGQTDTHPVVFTVKAAGYDSTGGKIPVSITGTDSSGSFVDATSYVGADGTGLSLSAGTYTVTVIESPLVGGGIFYRAPTTTWKLKISADLAAGASYTVSTPMKFTKVDSSSVSSSVIDTAYRYAISGGLSKSTADKYLEQLEAAR